MLKKIEYFLPTCKQCWLIVFFMVVAGSLAAAGIIAVLEMQFDIQMEKNIPLISYLLPMIPPFLYIYYSGRHRQESDPEGVAVPLDKGELGQVPVVLFALIAAAAIMTIGVISDPLTSLMEMPDEIKKILESLMQLSVLSIITTVIAAPVVEEFFLRGVMERGMLFHSTPAKAILWSAFFFALIHMNPWQAVPAFLAGLFLGWIYWRTHSLAACIFLHFVNNGMAILYTVLFPDIKIDTSMKEILQGYGEFAFPVVYILSIAVLALALYYFNKKLPAPGKVWEKYKPVIKCENE